MTNTPCQAIMSGHRACLEHAHPQRCTTYHPSKSPCRNLKLLGSHDGAAPLGNLRDFVVSEARRAGDLRVVPPRAAPLAAGAVLGGVAGSPGVAAGAVAGHQSTAARPRRLQSQPRPCQNRSSPESARAAPRWERGTGPSGPTWRRTHVHWPGLCAAGNPELRMHRAPQQWRRRAGECASACIAACMHACMCGVKWGALAAQARVRV